MTEDEAKAAVQRLVGAAGVDRLARLTTMILAENDHQNLIARSTVGEVWARHILDSVQLLPLAGDGSPWLDIGTGGGFPGLAIAAVDSRPVVLVEPRRKRATFLAEAARQLELRHVSVLQSNVERIKGIRAGVISARAVASVQHLIELAGSLSTRETRWLLPRGRLNDDDVAYLTARQGVTFHVERSVSDGQGSILVLEGVAP